MKYDERKHEQLCEELDIGIRKVVDDLKNSLGVDALYAFGIYTTDEYQYFQVRALTKSRHKQLIDRGSKVWFLDDWDIKNYGEQHLDIVSRLADSMWGPDYVEPLIESEFMASELLTLLKKLREDEFTGSDIIVGIFRDGSGVIGGQAAVDFINPPNAAEKFEASY